MMSDDEMPIRESVENSDIHNGRPTTNSDMNGFRFTFNCASSNSGSSKGSFIEPDVGDARTLTNARGCADRALFALLQPDLGDS